MNEVTERQSREATAFVIVLSLFFGTLLAGWAGLVRLARSGDEYYQTIVNEFEWIPINDPLVAGIAGIALLIVGVWLLLRNHRIRQEAAR